MAPYVPLFGSVFDPRCREAARCFRAGLHLATCVITATAIESMLVAVARQQRQDEAKVMAALYRGSALSDSLKSVAGSLPKFVQTRLESSASIVSHWQNDAAHGAPTGITAGEAHHALDRVLIIAQQVQRHWEGLGPPPPQAPSAQGT